MIVYSKKIAQFIREIQQIAKHALSKEVGLKVGTRSFRDPQNHFTYPMNIVIYNNKSMLGYFDSQFYELGFHECLMEWPVKQLHQIVRHEIAHYLTFITHGNTINDHGEEFRTFCQKLGWGEEIYRASICLETALPKNDPEKSSVFRKVQKLMALATSSSQNESEQAMIKAQQLLLKHNLEAPSFDIEEEKIILKRILKQKREDGKMRAIGKIVETFFVHCVYHRSKDFTYLEILGSLANIEIAEYVSNFLQSELDRLWKQVQKISRLNGLRAKNSFFLGIAKGYCDKVQALKKDYSQSMSQGLMVLEKKLLDAKALAYPNLISIKKRGYSCAESLKMGEEIGKTIYIHPAIENTSLNTDKLALT